MQWIKTVFQCEKSMSNIANHIDSKISIILTINLMMFHPLLESII